MSSTEGIHDKKSNVKSDALSVVSDDQSEAAALLVNGRHGDELSIRISLFVARDVSVGKVVACCLAVLVLAAAMIKGAISGNWYLIVLLCPIAYLLAKMKTERSRFGMLETELQIFALEDGIRLEIPNSRFHKGRYVKQVYVLDTATASENRDGVRKLIILRAPFAKSFAVEDGAILLERDVRPFELIFQTDCESENLLLAYINRNRQKE